LPTQLNHNFIDATDRFRYPINDQRIQAGFQKANLLAFPVAQ